MPEDHKVVAQGFFRGGYAPGKVGTCGCRVALRKRGLKSDHGGTPPLEHFDMRSAGTARAPIRGDVDLEVIM
jgi:hypothetical protein